MNKLLELRGNFLSAPGRGGGAAPTIPKGAVVQATHMRIMLEQLLALREFWAQERYVDGALISVQYRDLVAKSNRLGRLLIQNESLATEIVGAKYIGDGGMTKHVITYYLRIEALDGTIRELEQVAEVVEAEYGGHVTKEELEAINDGQGRLRGFGKTNFAQIIKDCYYAERFSLNQLEEEPQGDTLVSLYKTAVDPARMLARLGIQLPEVKRIDDYTFRVTPDELALLREKIPYMLVMATRDLAEMPPIRSQAVDEPELLQIPAPGSEPVIGVIDTLFDERVYFADWVEYESLLDPDLPVDAADMKHGTAVSSLIVDGPTINPELDDGCGRFRVKHYGVAGEGQFSSFSVLKSIRQIVAANPTIKVWNLSLGAMREINRNFVSPEAAELDHLQVEYDVIFVIAGTNAGRGLPAGARIGAPADSINGLVVNGVNTLGKPASYHRVGPVLSFYHKPDVSYYGGDSDRWMRVCEPLGEAWVSGTSYAAPWVARKLAYLIHVMGFSREVAKALIIDSAAGWQRRDDASHAVGYGVVPVRIEDVLECPDDEIRFIVSGQTEAFETYAYDLPVPVVDGKHPFAARATLAYFTECTRQQGVDYTNTELDFKFGRVKEKSPGSVSLMSLDRNSQDELGTRNLPESRVRGFYRKWDNVKMIDYVLSRRLQAKKAYGKGLWGFNIKVKERLQSGGADPVSFAVVVTLKELEGKNRVSEFVKRCQLHGWLVQEIDIEQQVEVFIDAEEAIEFE